jgi:D-alanyl-lipoteichoic acid acyltransferase DltB (MBOAT superfamily)
MTLSSWLRDYVYTPIVMSMRTWGAKSIGIAVMATFLICGLWHGAAWTFIAWGAYYGILIIIYAALQPFLKKIPTPKNPMLSNLWLIIRIVFFFHLICLGWLFFRAESMGQAASMLQSMACNFNFAKEAGIKSAFFKMIFVSGILGIVQIFQFVKNDLMCVYKSPVAVQTLFYVVCFYLMVLYGVTGEQAFIYFQF